MRPLTVHEMEAIEGGRDKCATSAWIAGGAIAVGTGGLIAAAVLSGGAALPLLSAVGFKFLATSASFASVINACSS
jgi:hypothetical protein